MPVVGAAAVAAGVDPNQPAPLIFVPSSIVAAVVALRAWPELGRVLIA